MQRNPLHLQHGCLLDDSYLMTSVSSGIPGKRQSKYGGRSCESSIIFKGYSANLLHTGDTKDTDNPC